MQASQSEPLAPAPIYVPTVNPFAARRQLQWHTTALALEVQRTKTTSTQVAQIIAERTQLVENLFREKKEQVLQPPFIQRQGHCFVTKTQPLGALGDGLKGLCSPLRLFEDGRNIGKPHSLHAEIESTGLGKFSHWGEWLYFSSSDGGDPNTNGRTYSVRPFVE